MSGRCSASDRSGRCVWFFHSRNQPSDEGQREGGLPRHGSIAFNAAARAVLNFYRDPDDEDRRLMVTAKMNLTAESNGLAFRIDDSAVVWDDEPVDLSADELESLEVSSRENSKGAAKLRAIEFLEITLGPGEMVSTELFESADRSGIKEKTLRRATKEMGCRKRKAGMDGGFYWALPGDAP